MFFKSMKRSEDDLRSWLDKKGVDALRMIGIKSGQTILDFGCGQGNNTIPAAKIVGNQGVVYALDKDSRALSKLMRRAEFEKLNNIRRIITTGEIQIPLSDTSVDVVLLYDIFWYFSIDDTRLPNLLLEIRRVLKREGWISVFPTHIDTWALREKIENSGFNFKNKISGSFYHYDKLEKAEIFNFKRD